MALMDKQQTPLKQVDFSEVRYSGGRPKFDFRTTSVQNYKEFKKAHPEIKITVSLWRSIVLEYNQMFKEYILETGDILEIPENCGRLAINKKKRKKHKVDKEGNIRVNLPVDWKKSNEKGKLIYNMNYHTDGNFFGWVWFRKQKDSKNIKSRIKLSTVWYFKAMKDSKRMLYHYLTADKEHYHKYGEWQK